MDSKYSHLTEKDRIFIRIMLEKHYLKSKIANILKVDPSTIYREVKRNSLTHGHSRHRFYWSHSAQEKYLKRRKRGLKLEKDADLQKYVHEKLKGSWSPYQIEGRLKLENGSKIALVPIYIFVDQHHHIKKDVLNFSVIMMLKGLNNVILIM